MLLLVTECEKRHRNTLRELQKRGLFLYVCPYETAEFYCDRKEIGGVILDCIAAQRLAERLCQRLRQGEMSELPIAALTENGIAPGLLADTVLCNRGDVTEEMLAFCHHYCGWSDSPISRYHLYVDTDPTNTRYMGQLLPLSQTAHTLLRCIAYRAPCHTSRDDLLSLCFPPQQGNERQLTERIHEINRRAAEIDPRPLIVWEHEKGYRLRDGI